MSSNRELIEGKLKKGVMLINIIDSINYSTDIKDEAKKMLRENIIGLSKAKMNNRNKRGGD